MGALKNRDVWVPCLSVVFWRHRNHPDKHCLKSSNTLGTVRKKCWIRGNKPLTYNFMYQIIKCDFGGQIQFPLLMLHLFLSNFWPQSGSGFCFKAVLTFCLLPNDICATLKWSLLCCRDVKILLEQQPEAEYLYNYDIFTPLEKKCFSFKKYYSLSFIFFLLSFFSSLIICNWKKWPLLGFVWGFFLSWQEAQRSSWQKPQLSKSNGRTEPLFHSLPVTEHLNSITQKTLVRPFLTRWIILTLFLVFKELALLTHLRLPGTLRLVWQHQSKTKLTVSGSRSNCKAQWTLSCLSCPSLGLWCDILYSEGSSLRKS